MKPALQFIIRQEKDKHCTLLKFEGIRFSVSSLLRRILGDYYIQYTVKLHYNILFLYTDFIKNKVILET